MIEITDITIKNKGGKSRLYCNLIVDGNNNHIWYEVDGSYEQYLCAERIDGILINILLYCMEHNHDVKSDIPISEKLYYNLVNYLIPIIAKNTKKYNIMTINAPLSNKKMNIKNAVGTGLSCGVDSFYSILKHIDTKTEDFNVTHLTFFNAGSSGDFGGEKCRKLFKNRISEVSPAAEKMGLSMLVVDTNINEFLQQYHRPTFTFRALAIPLLLQKLFSVYYFASSYDAPRFHFSEQTTAGYDVLSCMCLSTEDLSFYSSGMEVNRLEKVEYIANYDIVKQFLNVCINDATNCSRCKKCVRTLNELYAINKLDDFKDVFDIEYYKKIKDTHIAKIIAEKNKYEFSKDIYIKLKENNIKISVKSYILSLKFKARNILAYIYHKFI